MGDALIQALEELADLDDVEDIVQELLPIVAELCKYRWLVELALALCTRRK